MLFPEKDNKIEQQPFVPTEESQQRNKDIEAFLKKLSLLKNQSIKIKEDINQKSEKQAIERNENLAKVNKFFEQLRIGILQVKK